MRREMTYSLNGQRVTNSAPASSSEFPQHWWLSLPKTATVNGPSVAFQQPDPSLNTAEQQSGLD